MKIKDNFLLLTLVPILVLFVGASFIRFMVLKDYLVAYEGFCNPEEKSCFVGCDNDECTENYYYSLVQKYGPNLYEQCGSDITDCAAAQMCLETNDEQCQITYCDANMNDNCDTIMDPIDSL